MADKHTTVRLNPALVRRVKAYARANQLTMTAVMERALSAYLTRPLDESARSTFQFPTFAAGGTLPGVDIDDTSSLLDIMDGLK